MKMRIRSIMLMMSIKYPMLILLIIVFVLLDCDGSCYFLLSSCCCQAYEVIRITIGTRPSTLAIVQAEAVAKALLQSSSSSDTKIKTSILPISAKGDISQGSSLLQDASLAMRNVDFTGALDDALMGGEIHVAVHSAKDIPPTYRWRTKMGEECLNAFQILCPLPRQDPCDVLIGPYTSLHDIMSSFAGDACRIGTSSIRRQAQLFAILNNHHCINNNNQIQVVNIRGNLEARLQALEHGTVDALILAKSGLNRLHLLPLDDTTTASTSTTSTTSKKYLMTDIPLDQMLPGLCQGIVAAVVMKMGNSSTDDDNDSIFWKENVHAAIALSAERAFLDVLDQGSIRSWHGRPPLAGLMRPVSPSEPAATIVSIKHNPASSSLEESSTTDKTNALDDDVEYIEQDWIFQGLLARLDGTKVLHASMQSSLFSTVSSQESDYYSSPILKRSKDEAARMATLVGVELLAMAGSHFLDNE